jgi:hypothetical protein
MSEELNEICKQIKEAKDIVKKSKVMLKELMKKKNAFITLERARKSKFGGKK